uniref:2Fe-2S ferredoxin-type domain-containing protein n=1 Tax=Helicotheca tamesis TaxID=374047 RepID=A0A7S2MJ24_9STRA|mmetsp:Transcript_16877/g.23132  ORF Transcript_16877/g.23132 Transcript_16877/m.23132 type:complete len:251 (+) Transcript_16877:103-855(+)|eukprot:CAMPEP_0185725636 /NCGR_PEP_ID=MMETSP1171-20130828/1850_1 /TAXON_ID=374046 /ORGANISM="Helicotheca tamensis, Strain CCMP826" /LENGTH=250 /DNA_ID=CAMNT_0028393811 /DNA_START=70 /DNA_END=822 /DNA_ORIENTATION=-
MVKSILSILFVSQALLSSFSRGFQTSPCLHQRQSSSLLRMAEGDNVKGSYDPKWKKTLTIAEKQALETGKEMTEKEKGLIGNIPVVFKSGNETKTTLALPNQPLSDVAVQAGAFIRYGCKKGECGTCEALCNGKYIRPCVETVPADLKQGQELVIQVKAIKSKRVSSGKFYTAKSVVMGFWNNLLGMVGFVKTRRAAKKNWEERQEYEDLIAKRTKEIKAERLAREAADAIAKESEATAKENEVKTTIKL